MFSVKYFKHCQQLLSEVEFFIAMFSVKYSKHWEIKQMGHYKLN